MSTRTRSRDMTVWKTSVDRTRSPLVYKRADLDGQNGNVGSVRRGIICNPCPPNEPSRECSMSILTIARFSRILRGTASLFTLAGVLSTGSVARAQQATSQVLACTGTMPGQLDGPVAIRLRLYNIQTGGARLFEERQTVTVTSETFTVRIGDATAGGVPATLFLSTPSLWIAYALEAMPDSQI